MNAVNAYVAYWLVVCMLAALQVELSITMDN